MMSFMGTDRGCVIRDTSRVCSQALEVGLMARDLKGSGRIAVVCTFADW